VDSEGEGSGVGRVAEKFEADFPVVEGVHGDAEAAGGEVLGGFEEELGGGGEGLVWGDGGLRGEGDDYFVVLADGELDISAEVEERVFEAEEAGAEFSDLEWDRFCCDLGVDVEGFVEADGDGGDGEAEVGVVAGGE